LFDFNYCGRNSHKLYKLFLALKDFFIINIVEMKHVLGFNSLLEIKKGWCVDSSDSKSVLVVPTLQIKLDGFFF
jgi:hypothetical protein